MHGPRMTPTMHIVPIRPLQEAGSATGVAHLLEDTKGCANALHNLAAATAGATC